MDLFKLLGTIAIDNKDANKALDDTSQKGENTESKLSGAFSKIGQGAIAAGKVIATGLAAGATAMGTLTVKALNLSGELEQNMGGSEAVFKKYAENVQSIAKEAFSNMGLSTSDYLATANKMGALFQGAGFSIKESMDISSEAMQRAADVASIMGIDTSSAMEAIAGAAKGNFTMMDNLGVAMNDTTLEAYALSKGIDKATKDMTNQEKIGLAMQMFMEKTAYAAGNYAKENETLAGSLGTAKAALKNFLDGSGTVDDLVTSFTNASDVIIENVKTLAPRLISGISEVVSKITPEIPGIIQEMLPVIITGAVSLFNGVVEALPSMISILWEQLPVLLSAVGDLLSRLATFITDNLPIFTEKAKDMMSGLGDKIRENMPEIISKGLDILLGLSQAILENLPQLVASGMDIIISLAQGLMDALPDLLAKAPTIISNFANTISNSMQTILMKGCELVWELIKGIIQAIPDLVQNIPAIIQAIFDVWNAVNWLNLGKNLINGIKEGIKNMGGSLKNTAKDLFTKLKDVIKGIFDSIKTAIKNPMNSAKSLFSTAINGIKSAASSVFNSMKSNITSIFNGIKTAITNPIQTAKNTIKTILDTIKGLFSKLNLKFPNIPLPHFSIKPAGWKIGDLLEGSIPSLGIQWYAKAMNDPIIMTSPTIFGYDPSTGSLMGGGEKGSEVVSGTDTLMNMIQGAVATENRAVVYYLQKLIEILAEYFPQVLEALDVAFDEDYFFKKNASKIDKELGLLQAGKARGR